MRAVGHPDVFYVEDRELTIEQVVEAPLPQCPVDIGVMMHWLVVNGVQPSIPENAPLEPRKKKQRSRANQASTRAVGKAVPLLRSGADGDKPGDPKDPTSRGPGAKSLATAKGGGKGKEPPAEDVQVSPGQLAPFPGQPALSLPAPCASGIADWTPLVCRSGSP